MSNLLPPSFVSELAKLPGLAVAFSGGIDSRFLLHSAKIMGKRLLALHVCGPNIAADDTVNARAWAQKKQIPYLELVYNPLTLPEVRRNSRIRCYLCKKLLLAAIVKAMKHRQDGPWVICDGSHAGDNKTFRPGTRALREAAIASPLAQAGLDKAQVRLLATATGLDNPEQRSRPCLLTRLAYGLEAREEILQKLAACEAELARILPAQTDYRLRLAPEPVLQVAGDIPSAAAASEIAEKYGFSGLTIRKCESVSGFFDVKATF